MQNSAVDFSELLPISYTNGQRAASNIAVRPLPRNSLFGCIDELLNSANVGGHLDATLPLAAFVISPTLAVTVNRVSVRPYLFQCFLLALQERAVSDVKKRVGEKMRTLFPTLIDPLVELTVWASSDAQSLEIGELWNELSKHPPLKDVEIATTPKLYGNKTRLLDFIRASFLARLPSGAHVLDLMSGTGIVTRALSENFSMSANDANPYAALLTRVQAEHLSAPEVSALLKRISLEFEKNAANLRILVQKPLDREALFLHDDFDRKQLESYAEFCDQPVLMAGRKPPTGEPYQMCTARYANLYFGVAQCVELDSIRAAIDIVEPQVGSARDTAMAALVIAATICNTAPHFAQPSILRSHKTGVLKSLTTFKNIAERRARSVYWEFELALGRLADRPLLKNTIGSITQLNWREALEEFAAQDGSGLIKAIYLDPPYSKLQYSRYYHVLNSLISYDYPTVTGSGRYPPMEQRFSSKFENQPSTARKEFDAVFCACARLGLRLFLSYSDTGFVGINELIELVSHHFQNVDVLSEKMRHHSQGVQLIGSQGGEVTEYLIVAR